MHLYQVLLAIVVFLLVNDDALAGAKTETQLPTVTSSGSTPSSVSMKNSLRIDAGDDNNSSSTEERGFWTKIKVRWWLETEKSDEYVKKALELDGLSGTALTSSKNYKYFQRFVETAHEYKLNKWLTKDVTTYSAWRKLKLDKVPVEKLEYSSAFKTYVEFMNLFDDNAIKLWGAYKLPKMVGASKTEMLVKTRIWAKAKRTDEYVKKTLGLEGLSGKALTDHTNFSYYKSFIDALKKNGN